MDVSDVPWSRVALRWKESQKEYLLPSAVDEDTMARLQAITGRELLYPSSIVNSHIHETYLLPRLEVRRLTEVSKKHTLCYKWRRRGGKKIHE